MKRAVDFSQYGGVPSQETLTCWKDQGYSRAIVQYSTIMQQSLIALAQNGNWDIDIYVYLYWKVSPWGQTPMERVQAAISLVEATGVKVNYIWLDCELEGQSFPFNAQELHSCVDIVKAHGYLPGIYTAMWYWVPQTGDNQEFSDLPLWVARYLDLEPDDFQELVLFGGWTSAHMWQWRGTTTLCNHSVDLNVYSEEVNGPDMDEAKQDALNQRNAFVLLTWQLTDDSGQYQIGPGPSGWDSLRIWRRSDGQVVAEIATTVRPNYWANAPWAELT